MCVFFYITPTYFCFSVTIMLMLQSNVKMKIKTIKLFDSLYVVFKRNICKKEKLYIFLRIFFFYKYCAWTYNNIRRNTCKYMYMGSLQIQLHLLSRSPLIRSRSPLAASFNPACFVFHYDLTHLSRHLSNAASAQCF